MNVDGSRIAGERVTPHALEQLVAGQHEAAVVEQLPEQVELLGRETDLFVNNVNLALARVDREVAMTELLRLALPALRRGAAQDALDSRDELARVERLRHVVVGADLEPDDLVDVLIARGEHQDRNVGALADPAAELDAVSVGKIEVEDDERRRSAGDLAINSGKREVHVGDEEIRLAPKEFDLLWELLDHRGIVLTRDQLLERVWGYTFAGDTRTVDVHVRQIRRKLGDASPIVTVWGVGYKVASERASAPAV